MKDHRGKKARKEIKIISFLLKSNGHDCWLIDSTGSRQRRKLYWVERGYLKVNILEQKIG